MRLLLMKDSRDAGLVGQRAPRDSYVVAIAHEMTIEQRTVTADLDRRRAARRPDPLHGVADPGGVSGHGRADCRCHARFWRCPAALFVTKRQHCRLTWPMLKEISFLENAAMYDFVRRPYGHLRPGSIG